MFCVLLFVLRRGAVMLLNGDRSNADRSHNRLSSSEGRSGQTSQCGKSIQEQACSTCVSFRFFAMIMLLENDREVVGKLAYY